MSDRENPGTGMTATVMEGIYRPRSRLASVRRTLWRFMRNQPLGTFGGAIVALFILLGAFGPYIVPFDPFEIGAGPRLEGPSWRHLLGTDAFGRDQLSRIIIGARLSVFVGFGAVLIGTGVATILGLWVGYMGGRSDMIVQRIVDGVMSYPPLVLALVAVGVLGPSTVNITLVLGGLMIAGNSRVIRGSTLAVKGSTYVEAARMLGASTPRIILRHVLPNVVSPLIVIATVSLGSVILAEGALSFLGLGVPPPTPSWGRMIGGEESRFYFATTPSLVVFPGIALTVVVFAFNMFGDALRDVLDPRLRGEGL
jgi:peptide/nickel transport system permease protein